MRIIIKKHKSEPHKTTREKNFKEYLDTQKKDFYTTEDRLPTSPIDYARFRLLRLKKFVWGKKSTDHLKINDREKWERIKKWVPYYDNEINKPYDVITNETDLKMYLLNPDIAHRRFRTLQLSDVKHKYLLITKNVAKTKLRPHGKFYYLLKRGSRFPYNYVLVNSLPDYLTIQYDSLKNRIRITGSGAHPFWKKF